MTSIVLTVAWTLLQGALPGEAVDTDQPLGCTCVDFLANPESAPTESFSQYDPNKFFTMREYTYKICQNGRPATFEDAVGASHLAKFAATLGAKQILNCCEFEEVTIRRRKSKNSDSITSYCKYKFACPYGQGPFFDSSSWGWTGSKVARRKYCQTSAEYYFMRNISLGIVAAALFIFAVWYFMYRSRTRGYEPVANLKEASD